MHRGNMVRGTLVSAVGVIAVIESLRLQPYRDPQPVGDHTFSLIIGRTLMIMGLILFFRRMPIDPRIAWQGKK